MFDEDYYNFYNGTTTSTETEQETSQTQSYQDQSGFNTTSSYNPYQTTSSYDSDYDDDYSVTPNYNEEVSYQPNNSTNTAQNIETEQVKVYRKMDMPVIERQQEVVTLTKTRQRVELQPRMKIAITMFAIIMFSMIFTIIWNFASVGKLNSSIANKQIEINNLNASISGLKAEYTLLGDEEQLRNLAQNAGYVDSDESNTYYVSAGDFHSETSVEELPSNWFNDFCNFFSNLFN